VTREHITTLKKVLTANDLGRTGSHQVGIVVPKRFAMSTFFPLLPYDSVNPRRSLTFIDTETGANISTNFIYYNNKRRGKTRDEFRMTGIAAFCRSKGADVGDSLIMRRIADGRRTLEVLKASSSRESPEDARSTVILSDNWVVIGGLR
jgi:hypothetical protein